MSGGKLTFIFAFLLTSSILYSCEDCEDCGPLLKEPTVSFKFINRDSLEKVQARLTVIEEEIAEISTNQSSTSDLITALNTQLQTIELDITNGVTGLEELRNDLIAQIDSLQTTFEELQQLRLEKDAELTFFGSVETDIESGKIFIDSLVSKTDMTSGDFGEDSLTVFKFPVSINRDTTAYGIFIGEQMFELSLEYKRNFGEDERSRIEVVVSDVKILDGHTFDEVEINCEVCVSNETTITAYL